MLRYGFAILLLAMGLHTVWQAFRAAQLGIGYGHGHRITIVNPKWYHRGLCLCVGVIFLIGAPRFFWLSAYRVPDPGSECNRLKRQLDPGDS
jgi:hypothetical protein